MYNATKVLCVCFLLMYAVALGQQQQEPVSMTNASVVQMVQSKISPDLIILAISKSEPHFLLDPANTKVMTQMGVTSEIFKAMAAKQMGQPIPGYNQQQQQPPAPASPAPATPSQPVEIFRGQGSKEIGFAFTGVIPHVAPSTATGEVDLHAGYFFTHSSVVGIDVLGVFENQVQDVYISGYYRYYAHTGNPKLFPFFGGGAGGNIVHVGGDYGATASNFIAKGEVGFRYFVAKHVAVDTSYNLIYVHVAGAGFKDSTASQIGVGLSTVF